MSMHTDPRLSRLLASPEPSPTFRTVARQADGHGQVRFRRTPDAHAHAMIPDGDEVRVLRTDGDLLRVTWRGDIGFVKKRNLVAVPMAKAAPKPASKPAPKAAPKAAPKPAPKAAPKPAPKPAAAPQQLPPVVEPAPLQTTCSVTVNGKQYTIDLAKDTAVTGMTTVHDWVDANVLGARMRRNCGIGFCGACLCMLSYKDPVSGTMMHRAFNSCLRPILSCNGMSITTIAGVGTAASPHPTQKALADHSGTQCGYCSSAVVMNLYSHLSENQGKDKSPIDFEKIMDCNTCRCTGYRPILDTYKSFATTPPGPQHRPEVEVREDLRALPHPELPRDVSLPVPSLPTAAAMSASSWGEPQTEADLQKALAAFASQPTPPADLMLVGGRTSQGVWGDRKPDAFINIGGIASLKVTSSGDDGVVIGAGVTMHDAIEFLTSVLAQNPDKAGSFKQVIEHTHLSPGHTIRNTGTVGGNVSLSHEHQTDGKDFPLEWPLMFMALGATVTIVDMTGKSGTMDMEAFYTTDMKFKYIQKFTIPWDKPGMVFCSYRASKRHVYSHAILAAAMRAEVADGIVVKDSVRIVFNNIKPVPARMATVEGLMGGTDPQDEANFQQALIPALQKDAVPVTYFGDKDFRKSLALTYFYKFMLSLQPSLPAPLQSAAKPWLDRPLTTSTQTFQDDPSVYPVSKAMPKIDALQQTCGEANYVCDLPQPQACLHAGVVMAEQIGDIVGVDSSAAQKMPGFVRLVTKADLPAERNAQSRFVGHNLLADKTADFIGHLVAIVLAETPEAARDCAKAVKVTYQNTRKPIMTTDDAVAAKSFFPEGSLPVDSLQCGDVDGALKSSDHTVTYTFQMGHQYHYHMETQSVLAWHTENGLQLHAATQVPSDTQRSVAAITGLPQSKVDVHVRRCGGGFGGKLDNSIVVAQATAVACQAAGRPVRMVMEIEDNMRMMGMRAAWRFDTTVGCNNDGTITAVRSQAYLNCGAAVMPFGGAFAPVVFLTAIDNCYNIKNWDTKIQAVKTDKPPTAACRAPGWLPGTFSIERVIAEVAAVLKMSPDAVRMKNFYKQGDTTPYKYLLSNWNVDKLVADIKTSSKFEQRQKDVAAFNGANRWVKKGIALMPSKFAIGGYIGTPLLSELEIAIGSDGSVACRSGGTEIGQGLTTKVAQTVAYRLGCDMSEISFQEYTSTGGFGLCNDGTGGSITSEMVCLAAKDACDQLKPALDAAKAKLPAGTQPTWANIVGQAFKDQAVLQAHGYTKNMAKSKDAGGDAYNTCGVAVIEVEVDALTGQLNTARCDILYDLGRSVNPTIDIGQIEGAYVMSAGYALTEQVDYDENGMMDWSEYKPPTPWEIPGEWNITLYNGAGPNPCTVGGGKAIGEPPMSLAYGLLEAAEQAFGAAAAQGGKTPALLKQVPLMVADRQKLSQITPDVLRLK